MNVRVIPMMPSGGAKMGFFMPDERHIGAFREAQEDALALAQKDSVQAADAEAYTTVRALDSIQRRAASKGGRVTDSTAVAPIGTLTQRLAAILGRPAASLEGLNPELVPQRPFTGANEEKTEVARTSPTGSVTHLRGSSTNIPMVDVEMDTETFDRQIFVCGCSITQFEQASTLNRLFNLLDMRMTAVRTVQGQAAHRRTIDGDPVTGLPGMLSHPWVADMLVQQVFDGNATYKQLQTALGEIMSYVPDTTNEVGNPDSVRIAARLARFLSRVTIDGSANSLSVWKWFLEEYGDEFDIKKMHSLNKKGKAGEDGMYLFSAADGMSFFNDVPQGLTMVAPQTREFSQYFYFYMMHAGTKSFNAHHNLRAWLKRAA